MKAKEIYEIMARKLERPVIHCISLMYEGAVHERLENVNLRELVKEQICKSGLWKTYSAGIVISDSKEVGVFASEHLYDQETAESEHIIFIALREPVTLVKRSKGAWRERVYRNQTLQYESVPFEKTVKINAPVNPELVEEIIKMLRP